jgi:DNA polymerase-3 subunit gamma/tau
MTMLAERYRPQTFDDVIGQDRTIAAMRWYLDQSSANGLAMLLTGPSGSGKTSLAECAARYWGCTDFDIHRVESAQCDVTTLRDLADNMRIYGAGSNGRKMYLIDEVHTVTGRAADRMLSLLENVPAHVLVIGTTTEPAWTDGILLSRWVRFDLQKVSSAEVARHVERIAQRERLPIPTDPKWAEKLVKYHGLNIRDQLNQLPARLLTGMAVAA